MLLDRLRLRPVLEANEARIRIDQLVARPIDERDGVRLELLDAERRQADATSVIVNSCAWTLAPQLTANGASPTTKAASLQAPHHDIFHQYRRLPQM